MKSAGDAPAPDPQIGQAALMQAKTGQQWLSFAKDAFKVSTARQADLDKLTKQVSEQQLGLARDQSAWARADRKRYDTQFRPIEDSFVKEASNYGTPARQAEAAAEAQGDVRNAAAQATEQARREAAAAGINPASGRYAGIERSGELGTALAVAGAGNSARQQVRDKALALKADVVNLGRGLPAQSAAAATVGLNAGNSAVGLKQGANAQFLQSTSIMGQGYQGQMAGYQGQANTLNQQYNTQVQAWDAQQRANAANAAGIGQAVGGIVGLFASDENVKKDKVEIEDGKALDAIESMPVEEWTYKEGVADGGRHVGPYAQDFQEATGTGDGKTIAVQDAIGLTMRAVQDLSKKVDRLAAEGLGARRKIPARTEARAASAQPAGLARRAGGKP